MKITIKTLQGKPTEFQVDESTTLLMLKQMISGSLNVPVESQKLIHYGKVLGDDANLLINFGVKDNDFLVLMVTRKAPAAQAPTAVPQTTLTVPTQAPAAPISAPQTAASLPVPVAPTAPIVPPAPEGVGSSSASGSPSKPAALEERLVTGVEYEATVTSLMEMGFSREEVVSCMKAAYCNPERATEYLLNGIPPGMEQPRTMLGGGPIPRAPAASPLSGPPGISMLPGVGRSGPTMPSFRPVRPPSMPPPGVVPGYAPAAPAPAPPSAPAPGIPGVPGGSLDELRSRILSDPSYLQAFLQELQTANPAVHQLIQQNPQMLFQLLGSGGPGGMPRRPPGGGIQVTHEEKEAIDRLKGLGFTEMQAAQAFFACDKNEMMAANFLFENSESLREEMEGEAGLDPHGGPPASMLIRPRPLIHPGPSMGTAPASAPVVPPTVPSVPFTAPPAPFTAPSAPSTAPPAPPAAPEVKMEQAPPEKKEEAPEKKEEESSLQLDPNPEEKKND